MYIIETYEEYSNIEEMIKTKEASSLIAYRFEWISIQPLYGIYKFIAAKIKWKINYLKYSVYYFRNLIEASITEF